MKKYASWFVFFSLLLPACGSSGIVGNPATVLPQDSNTGFGSGSGTGSGGGQAAYYFSFSTSGFAPTVATTELRTDTLLTVQVTAGPAGANTNNSQVKAVYNCAIYKITLQVFNGTVWQDLSSVVTSSLNVPGTAGCDGGKANQTIDFSAYMIPGHGNVKIKVESMETDFLCLEYNKCVDTYNSNGHVWTWDCTWVPDTIESFVCPTHEIYSYHTVTGTLQVQVNGTQFQ